MICVKSGALCSDPSMAGCLVGGAAFVGSLPAGTEQLAGLQVSCVALMSWLVSE